MKKTRQMQWILLSAVLLFSSCTSKSGQRMERMNMQPRTITISVAVKDIMPPQMEYHIIVTPDSIKLMDITGLKIIKMMPLDYTTELGRAIIKDNL